MHRLALVGCCALVAACAHAGSSPSLVPVLSQYPQHDLNRPQPPVVTPGSTPTAPPSDAIVLFDGTSTANWVDEHGAATQWTVQDGALVVKPGNGGAYTRQSFGDVQLHVEWSAPNPPSGEGQERGNSGVFLMSTYEVQVLDSYHATTYPDGQAGSIFGQYPPLVNPALPPGEWNRYDIVFHRPHFNADGSLAAPARMTILFNGVLVQDNAVLVGPTTYAHRAPYAAHADALPLMLQDHEYPVRYRNVWVRRLN